MKLSSEILQKGISYSQYISIIKNLYDRGLHTGTTQTPGYLEYTKINLQRYGRLEKTVILSEPLSHALQQLVHPVVIYILTEGWCGDAAQNIAVFEAMAKHSDKINVRYLFRDQNPELMNEFLTDGSRSIPKALIADAQTFEIKFSWGPRPAVLQTQVKKMISEKISKEDRGLFIHSWYHKDQTHETQKELAGLLKSHD